MNTEPSRLIDLAKAAPLGIAEPFAPPPPEAPPAPDPLPAFEDRTPAPVHAPIDVPLDVPADAGQIVRMNIEKPDDQATRFSQFMGDQSPEASLEHPVAPSEARIDEVAVNPEEKTGVLQTGVEALAPIEDLSMEATKGFELPAPDPAPELELEDAREAMEKTYSGLPTPEAQSGERLEIKDTAAGTLETNPSYEIKSEPPPEKPAPAFGAALEENWYVRMGGEVLGPFTPEEIRKGLERKEFHPDSPMSSSPDGPWKRIDGFPQFAPPAKAA
jgi:hypothetical protein